MSVFEWMIMFCMITLAVCAIVFPILMLAQRGRHHKEWMQKLAEEHKGEEEKEDAQG